MEESTTFDTPEQVNRFLALTVDVEQSFAPSFEIFEKSVESMLETFSARGWVATCFVEGAAAEKCPGLLRSLADAGHEVGSHGYRHQDQRILDEQALQQDVDRALDLFASEGVPCAGYRAPFFLRNPHLDEVLLTRKVPFDSSLPRTWFPGRYDNRHLPSEPFVGSKGLVHVPVGRTRPWLPLSVEHHKAIGFLFPKHLDLTNQVMYVHSYSFGSGFKRPFYNRNRNQSETLHSIEALSSGATLGPIGELLQRTGVGISPVEDGETRI